MLMVKSVEIKNQEGKFVSVRGEVMDIWEKYILELRDKVKEPNPLKNIIFQKY